MKNRKTPAWMRSTRPDTIFKNCLNVQDGLVEAVDFDPAMCEPCENTECKWLPGKLDAGRVAEDSEEEEDDDGADTESEDDLDQDSAATDDADDDERG